MAFSLSTASRDFTKVFALVLGLLRTQGISIVGHLNDLLLREHLAQKLISNVQQMMC